MSDLKRRAIALLARREHSRAELARKLSNHGTPEEIEPVLSQLESQGLLSDSRAAAAFVRARSERFGAARLRQDLRSRGIGDEVIEAEVAELPDELERARAVWVRKFSQPPADARQWARQARFLQGRGFSTAVIRRILKEAAE